MNGHGRLGTLDGLRGYAAMLVFVTHSFGLLAQRAAGGADVEHLYVGDASDPVLAGFVFLFHSHYGVDLFFVLSGLLMADIAVRRWPGTQPFLAQRALRIYPPYLAALAIAIGVAVAMSSAVAVGDAAANLVLLQGFFPLGIRAINPVTWSLSYEAGFYIAVPVMAAVWGATRPGSSRGRHLALALLFVAIVVASAMLELHGGIYLAYFALFIPGIALGLLEAPTRLRIAERLPVSVVVVAWAAFTLSVKTGLVQNTQPGYYAASAAACGLLVLKACDPASGFGRPPMRWLGRYSYSFFLVHYVIVHAWAAVIARPMAAHSRLAYAAVLVAGSLALSLAAARLLYEATERWYFSRRPSPAPEPPGLRKS